MLYDNDIIEHDGARFRVEFPFDDSGDTPWDREDGHGPVSEWRSRSNWHGYVPKAPGERPLCTDCGSARFYDFAEAVKIARRDGWGYGGKSVADWQATGLTLGAIAHNAAEADFQFLCDWCNDRWHYVGVVVELVDDNDEPTGETESVWGIESCSTDYLEETAHELAGELLAGLKSRAA